MRRTVEDANDNVEATIGSLHLRYAFHGKTLGEAEEELTEWI